MCVTANKYLCDIWHAFDRPEIVTVVLVIHCGAGMSV